MEALGLADQWSMLPLIDRWSMLFDQQPVDQWSLLLGHQWYFEAAATVPPTDIQWDKAVSALAGESSSECQ